MVNHPNRAKPEATKLMQAAQKQNQLGRIEVTLAETGEFYARAYPPNHQLATMTGAHIKANGLRGLSIDEFGELADKIADTAIAQGKGRTVEDALRELRERLPA